jgi:hypothetical protein
MSDAGRVDLATWRRLPAMTVLQRRPVVSAAVLAAVPALGFAMLTTAGAAAAGPSPGPTCDPTETSSATPSDSISPSILATPSVLPSPQPAVTAEASPAASASPSCLPSPASPATASEQPSESAATDRSASPSADAREIQAAATEPRPAGIRGVLTADESKMAGFGFAGVVTQQTEAGDVRALRFIADTNTLTGMRLTVTHAGVTQTTRGGGDPTVMSGHVVMDVTVFMATLLGEPVEFTPDNPPPAALIQPDMTFTDVEAHLVFVTCDEMTIDGMTQSLSGG